jgi:hypothetical protein
MLTAANVWMRFMDAMRIADRSRPVELGSIGLAVLTQAVDAICKSISIARQHNHDDAGDSSFYMGAKVVDKRR